MFKNETELNRTTTKKKASGIFKNWELSFEIDGETMEIFFSDQLQIQVFKDGSTNSS